MSEQENTLSQCNIETALDRMGGVMSDIDQARVETVARIMREADGDDAADLQEYFGDAEQALINSDAVVGYRRPRTIETLDELNALPTEVVVLDADNVACQQDFTGIWTSGGEMLMPELIPLPATVLWEPNN